MKTIAFLLLSAVALTDSSGTRDARPREWRDEAGRVIKRLDAWGRMLFYTYDEQGRVVEIACEQIWVHRFRHESDGLVQEMDCMGRLHDFVPPRKLDVAAGTALEGHRHGGAPRPKPTSRLEHDAVRRLTAKE